MSATAESLSFPRRPGGLSWLRRELAPFPGRDVTTLRMVAGVVLVVIISMTLQTPETALSAYMVFFVTKENRALTLITGVLMMVGVTIAIAASLFLSRFTFDYPELRIPVMAATVFAGMYLSRAFVIGPLGFAIGFVVAVTQTMGEGAPDAELLVRAFLWLWVAVIFPIFLTVVLNQVLWPAHPWNALVRGLTQRLDAASAALEKAMKEGVAGGQRDAALLNAATGGSSPLLANLKFASLLEAPVKHRHAALAGVIAASERVAGAAATLALRSPRALSENDRRCAGELRAEIARLRAVAAERNPLVPVPVGGTLPTMPELRELQLAVVSFRDCLAGNVPAGPKTPAPKKKKSLFVADAFSNPAHARFALKVTLAAMTCYFIYTGLNWPGIHTAFITCCFIALENTGATTRKGLLRFVGCAIGGLLGFFSIMYLVPRMESIVSLALLAATGAALAGWVATGSERISYGGMQIGFAFFMCIFQGFAPGEDLDTIRDRVVGIFLGLLVSSIIFRYLWPERAVEGLRTALASALRNLASLLVIPRVGAKVEEERGVTAVARGDLGKGFDNIGRLSELATLEDEGETLTSAELESVEEQARIIYVITTALASEAEREMWQRLAPKEQEAEAALRAVIAEKLRRAAMIVEGGQPPKPASTVWESKIADGQDRARLLHRVIQEVQRLEAIVAGKNFIAFAPAWRNH